MKTLGEAMHGAINAVAEDLTGQKAGLADAPVDLHGAIRDAMAALDRAAMRAGWSDAACRRFRDAALKSVRRGIEACESPIEKLILPWLMTADYATDSRPATVVLWEDAHRLPPDDVVIVPQMPFRSYRLDFGVIVRSGSGGLAMYAFECDGAEFHQDAGHDERRDRDLASWGFTTVRVSGADIYRAPSRAADKLAHLIREVRRK